MKDVLNVSDVSISYGKREVVHRVSASISDGEFCALLGLNGSGKSTLLKGICGLIPVENGTCTINGMEYLRFHEKQRAKLLSYIPQRMMSLEKVPVEDVVCMGFNASLKFFQSPGKREKQLALEALRQVNMEGYAKRDIDTLSEGQKQLIVLARAIVQNAPVMLLDEPDSALDFKNKHMVLEKVSHIIHSEKRAGLITLHDPNFAMQYCDRLFLLKDGNLITQINMHSCRREEIQEKLSIIYGNIDVIRHGDGFWMGKA